MWTFYRRKLTLWCNENGNIELCTYIDYGKVSNTSLVSLQAASDERYAFKADWYDPRAALTRKYLLSFYPKDSSVEMVMIGKHFGRVLWLWAYTNSLNFLFSVWHQESSGVSEENSDKWTEHWSAVYWSNNKHSVKTSKQKFMCTNWSKLSCPGSVWQPVPECLFPVSSCQSQTMLTNVPLQHCPRATKRKSRFWQIHVQLLEMHGIIYRQITLHCTIALHTSSD